MPNDTPRYSVWAFFPDGSHTKDPGADHVDADTAIRRLLALTETARAKAGGITRIMITDAGDFSCCEWQHGKGIVFPKEMRAGAAPAPLVAPGFRVISFDADGPHDLGTQDIAGVHETIRKAVGEDTD
jgi:hypothetical protein